MKKLIIAVLLSIILSIILSVFNVNAEEEERFELPISGTTGFASVTTNVQEVENGKTLVTIVPGTAFTILEESSDYFYIKVRVENQEYFGWVSKRTTLVNLPDLIPSIVYYDTNSIGSMFSSSEYPLEGIYGEKLYEVYLYNERFEKDTFTMPVLYGMACKIMDAQQKALKDGNSLKIYETFRPHEVQMQVSSTLSNLMNSNPVVYKNIASWGKGWFIATSYSNHQRGRAMDCSLVKVNSFKYKNVNSYTYKNVTSYSEYVMPTNMHELSAYAVTFQYGVNSSSWKSAPLSSGMKRCEGAQLLQKYCTEAGMTPLASEWWHFDDNTNPGSCNGEFFITECVSEKPE